MIAYQCAWQHECTARGVEREHLRHHHALGTTVCKGHRHLLTGPHIEQTRCCLVQYCSPRCGVPFVESADGVDDGHGAVRSRNEYA